ncbi:MAG: hypothetical protein ACLP50_31640 [Solirubrobacteraceae bacterium]
MISSGMQASMRLTVSSVEQLKEYVGRELGTSDWRAVTQHDWLSEEHR